MIQIHSGALDEVTIKGEKRIILRGIVEMTDLHKLQYDTYQREAQPLAAQQSIVAAIKSGEPLPDIELGMRGQKFKERADGVIELYDQVFIIDGLQRVSTAIYAITGLDAKPRLGATIHFDTTREWERQRFHTLNVSRLKVNPAVIIRNMADHSPMIRLLLDLTRDPVFALKDRVQWNQRMRKGELISARVLLRAAGRLHGHIAPGATNITADLVEGMDKLVTKLGSRPVSDNIAQFYEIVDEAWGIRKVSYIEGARHLRGTFLFALASFLSDHTDFWTGNKLTMAADLRRKLRAFPVNTDPNIGNLTGASGKATELLYMLLADHINSGKRTRRLRHRYDFDIRKRLEKNYTPAEEETV